MQSKEFVFLDDEARCQRTTGLNPVGKGITAPQEWVGRLNPPQLR